MTRGFDVGAVPVKSSLDRRDYRSLALDNGLKVLLVSDTEHQKAAAAMNVSVGLFNDPESIPGLAHFLEHMLFLGTEKYPDEGSYHQFLSEKGGYSNAYTTMESTNYQFQLVVPKPQEVPAVSDGQENGSPLYEALDRFSQFFVAPLFTEGATLRELNAVDSEHEKNLQSDACRLYQLSQACANPGHPYSRFGTGSKATLWDIPRSKAIDTRQALLDFYEKHYSANRMSLCVVGPYSLDVMQEWIVELFSPVVNKSLPHCSHDYRDIPPLTAAQMGRITYAVPIKDVRTLGMSWLVPSVHSHYRSKPADYLSHLLGHEGSGSLLSLLKSRGWADSLVSGVFLSVEEFAFFDVHVDLTKEGIDHVEDIVELTFGYLSLVSKSGVEEWVFEESAARGDMTFRFSEGLEPFQLVRMLSAGMPSLKEEDYLAGPYIWSEFKPELIHGILRCLTPDRVNVTVTGHFVENTTNCIEKWYGTAYRIETVNRSVLEKWQRASPIDGLAMPSKNPFLPTDFSLVTDGDGAKNAVSSKDEGPVLLIDSDKVELHYALDRTFQRPKVTVHISLRTPVSYASPKSHVLCNIFTSLLEDQLTEYSYDAELAGLTYSLHACEYGIRLVVSGYNHRIDVLTNAILDKIASFKANRDRFSMIFDQWERQWANFDKDQPYQHAMYGITYLLETPRWHVSDYLECMRTPGEITAGAVDNFVEGMLCRMHSVVLVHGNVSEEWARNMCDVVVEKLGYRPLPVIELPRRRVVQLPNECSVIIRKEGANDDDRNSAVHVSYQVGVRGACLREDVLLELVCEMMNKPAFHELRTKQQLGYIVFTGVDSVVNVRGLYVIIQSTKSPEEVCERVEDFLLQFRKDTLEGMSTEDFAGFVQSAISLKLEREKRLSARSRRYFREITSGTFMYDRSHVEIEALRSLDREDVLSFFDKYIAIGGQYRRKVSSLVYGADHSMPSGEAALACLNANSAQEVKIVVDPVAFRASRPLYPVPGIHKPFLVSKSRAGKENGTPS